jgi:hypothetical protein
MAITQIVSTTKRKAIGWSAAVAVVVIGSIVWVHAVHSAQAQGDRTAKAFVDRTEQKIEDQELADEYATTVPTSPPSTEPYFPYCHGDPSTSDLIEDWDVHSLGHDAQGRCTLTDYQVRYFSTTTTTTTTTTPPTTVAGLEPCKPDAMILGGQYYNSDFTECQPSY